MRAFDRFGKTPVNGWVKRLSMPARLVLWVGVALFYALAYLALQPALGSGVAILSVIPVGVAALAIGMWGGAFSSLLLSAMNLLLLLHTDGENITGELWLSGVAGTVLLFACGVLVGRLRDLGLQVQEELAHHQTLERDLARKARELEALYRTSLEINAQMNLKKLLEAVVERAARLLETRMGGLYLLHPDEGELELVVSHNLPGNYQGTRLKLGEGLSGKVAQSGQPMMVEDYETWEGKADVYAGTTFRRVLALPLKLGSRVIGVLNVTDDRRIGPFSQEEVRLGSLFADQAAVAVENARLYESSQLEISERRRMEQAEHEQRLLAEALRDNAAALAGTLQLDQVLDRILENVGWVVPHDAANVMLLEGDSVRVVRYRFMPAYERYNPTTDIHFSLESIPNLQRMASTGRPVVIADTRNHPGWVVHPAADWIRSYAGAPMRVRGQIVGFLNVDSATPGFFDAGHAERLLAFADQAALAIENARLFEETARRARRLALVNEISTAINQPMELNAVLQAAVDGLVRAMNLSQAGLALFDENRQRLVVVADHTAPGGMPAVGIELQLEGNLSMDRILSTRRSLAIFDAQHDPLLESVRPVMKKRGVQSMLLVPIVIRGEVVGTIGCDALDQPRHFSEGEIDLAETIANLTAVRIEQARLFTQTQQLAITDALTGLYNRRGLFELGHREVERALRFQRPLAAVMIDIDHFKRVNDRYGHAAGDEVLRVLADRMRSNVREIDIVGRYGGEEFVILLPENSLKVALQVAERVRQGIVDSPIPFEGRWIKITVSLGVAAASQETRDLAALIEKADRALYGAKRSGRDRVSSQ